MFSNPWPFVLLASAAWAQETARHAADNVKEVLHGVGDPPTPTAGSKPTEPGNSRLDRRPERYSAAHRSPAAGSRRSGKRLRNWLNVEETSVPGARAGPLLFHAPAASVRNQPVLWHEGALDAGPGAGGHPLRSVPTTPPGQLPRYFRGWQAGGLRHSPGGEDEVTVKLLNVDSRRNLADELRVAVMTVSIEPSRAGLLLQPLRKAGRVGYHHVIGQPPARIAWVFRPGLRARRSLIDAISRGGRYS